MVAMNTGTRVLALLQQIHQKAYTTRFAQQFKAEEEP
jgi:hypothetical protein